MYCALVNLLSLPKDRSCQTNEYFTVPLGFFLSGLRNYLLVLYIYAFIVLWKSEGFVQVKREHFFQKPFNEM